MDSTGHSNGHSLDKWTKEPKNLLEGLWLVVARTRIQLLLRGLERPSIFPFDAGRTKNTVGAGGSWTIVESFTNLLRLRGEH